MNPTSAEPRFFDLHDDGAEALAAEAVAGLAAAPARVSPKFFYDALGSRLFDAITELDEYYPTRTEAAIVERDGPAIATAVRRVLGPSPTLIDLGAGNCEKAARWFPLLEPTRYVAVDISSSFLRGALAGLRQQWPRLDLAGVGLDFSRRLVLPEGLVTGPSLVLYPGSSIGNFEPEAALALLTQARRESRDGALLIGVDLAKDHAVLQAAYDDGLGVTAAFNLNLLRNLNRLLGADFDLRDWNHVARYDAAAGRIEMHIEAGRDVLVRHRFGLRRFVAGERIHTENSYKWRRGSFEALLRDAGYKTVRGWTDEREWFAVFLAS